MNIYIASFYDTRERLRPHIRALQDMGHSVISTWLKELVGTTNALPAEELVKRGVVTAGYMEQCALNDLHEIRSAHLLLLDTMDVSPRGGREVELGIALAGGIPAIVIGPRRNVFHYVVRQFETWEECLAYLREVHL